MQKHGGSGGNQGGSEGGTLSGETIGTVQTGALPKTGAALGSVFTVLGAMLACLLGFMRKKKEEDEEE